MKRMNHDVTLAKQWMAEFQGAPQAGAVPMGFAPDMPKPKPKKPLEGARVQAAKMGTDEWFTFNDYREAAAYTKMEPDAVKLVLAGNYNKKYKYQFRYLGGEVPKRQKGLRVVFRNLGEKDFRVYDSTTACSKAEGVARSTISRALNHGNSSDKWEVYFQGLESTTSDDSESDDEPILAKGKPKPLAGKPEQGPKLVEVDPPVKPQPPVPRTSRLPPDLPKPAPQAPDVPLPESDVEDDSDTEEALFQGKPKPKPKPQPEPETIQGVIKPETDDFAAEVDAFLDQVESKDEKDLKPPGRGGQEGGTHRRGGTQPRPGAGVHRRAEAPASAHRGQRQPERQLPRLAQL